MNLFYLPKSEPILSARKWSFFFFQKVDLFYQQESGLIELICMLGNFAKISFKNMISVNSLDPDDSTH